MQKSTSENSSPNHFASFAGISGELGSAFGAFVSTPWLLPRVVPRISAGASLVSMMETADLLNRDDPSEFWRLHRLRFRRVLTQREVCSGSMIIRHERPHVPMQR